MINFTKNHKIGWTISAIQHQTDTQSFKTKTLLLNPVLKQFNRLKF